MMNNNNKDKQPITDLIKSNNIEDVTYYQNNIENTIIELTHSENNDDIILGCRIAAEKMGRQWCKKHFHKRVPTSYQVRKNFIMLKFGKRFHIWIGPYGILFYAIYKVPTFGPHKLIDYAE